MSFDTTYLLLKSVLSSSATLDLFKTIAAKRIAEKAPLRAANADVDQELDALKSANLIDTSRNGEKYFVTAKGLQVERDLQRLQS